MATLRDLVVQLADHPTPANQDAFHRGLLASRVSVPLRTIPVGAVAGTQSVRDGAQWPVPTTRGPDGGLMLLVYTDQRAAMEIPQTTVAFDIAARAILQMALTNGAGVIVATGHGVAASWAGVRRVDVRAVLSLADKRA